MDASRKRHRGSASEAAARSDEGDAAAIPGREARHHAYSSKSAIALASKAEETPEDDSDYAVLVKRSSALLAKLGKRSTLANCATQTGSKHEEATEPMTLSCALESCKYNWHGASCSADSLTLPFATAKHTLSTEPIRRSAKCTQTDSSTSLEARKRLLAAELSELYTLLHVFFS
ncbi:hypothetical protein LSCM1_04388 [Leishmania martiniquensis]|uniref:Uncharacterized protein n=1 Tax=Leishmania martiniquensis TaxID=1580590 RepID=A0A836HBP8_9TRYP|nr:hypothetical protein LSCM1_04388 [Leishmania martiniquensis]